MIGEIRRIRFDNTNDQLSLFYQPELDNTLVLVIFLLAESYAHVFNSGRIYTVPCGYLKHVS